MNSHFVNSAKIEKIIHRLLSSQNNTLALVGDHLIDETKKQNKNQGEWNQRDVHAIASFLYHTSQYKNLVGFIDESIDKNFLLPWGFVSRLFSLYEQKDISKYTDYLIDGSKEQKSLEKIFADSSFDSLFRSNSLSSQLKKQYKNFLEKEKQKKKNKKENLFLKLERARNEKLSKEEGNILQDMIKMFPKDTEIQKEHSKYRENWAKSVFQKKKQNRTKRTLTANKYKDSISEEQKAYLDHLYKHIEKYIEELKIKKSQSQTKSQFIIDFSMLFYFSNAFDYALRILNSFPCSNEEIDWLKVEIKLKLHHFLDVLEETTLLSEKHKDHTETPFIVSYTQAIALWHLGKTEKAIHFMQDIVNNRPNYRLASLYLSRWKKGESSFEN